MKISRGTRVFLAGVRDGVPIGLGYFAVSFSLGIFAHEIGLTAVEGFWTSFLNVTSSGEYALFAALSDGTTYLSVALLMVIINARYLLMSCSLSQKFAQNTNFIHRFFVGFGLTDEIFAISIAQKGKLNPLYTYGAMSFAIPMWAIGTAIGVIAGGALPARIVSAFSVALYGMFIAIVIPVAKESKPVFYAVAISFVLSYICTKVPVVCNLSSGIRIIILTILIASVMAIVKPIDEEKIK